MNASSSRRHDRTGHADLRHPVLPEHLVQILVRILTVSDCSSLATRCLVESSFHRRAVSPFGCASRSLPPPQRPSSLLWRVGFRIGFSKAAVFTHITTPHAWRPSLERTSLEVLQTIRRLLVRPRYFRPGPERPRGFLTHRTRAPSTSHTQQSLRGCDPAFCGRAKRLDVQRHRQGCHRWRAPVLDHGEGRANGVEPHAYLSLLFAQLPFRELSRTSRCCCPGT